MYSHYQFIKELGMNVRDENTGKPVDIITMQWMKLDMRLITLPADMNRGGLNARKLNLKDKGGVVKNECVASTR